MLKTTSFRLFTAAIIGLGAIGVARLTLAASSALAAIDSNLYIEPRQTFVLGGKQEGPFTVRGENKGEVVVEVIASKNGDYKLAATAGPGDRFEAEFAGGESALLRNTSTDTQAYVKVRVTGSTDNLGMSYEGW